MVGLGNAVVFRVCRFKPDVIVRQSCYTNAFLSVFRSINFRYLSQATGLNKNLNWRGHFLPVAPALFRYAANKRNYREKKEAHIMYCPILVRTTTLSERNAINQSPVGRACFLVLVAVALASFTSSRTARAVSPAPDGGYPNGNTAEGTNALFSLTAGSFNTANGFAALYSNTTGIGNTATGVNTLVSNTGGIFNTATGVSALFSNTTGSNNTANGFAALLSNTTGEGNTANGFKALRSNLEGFNNTADGQGSLSNNTAGGFNTANGFRALANNSTGSSNIALGANAGERLTTGSNNIDIGNPGVAAEGNNIRIGKVGTQTGTFIAGIHGTTIANGVSVIIDSTGHIGTVTSSARFKEAIRPMDKASEAILALQPVTFRYKQDLDPDGIPQFGLIAEEVAKVNRDLVVRDENGEIYTVRYEAVNAMLLNEFLKEHRNVAEQQSTIAELKTTVAQQQKQIEALTSMVQKVSDQIALTKPAPQLVANP